MLISGKRVRNDVLFMVFIGTLFFRIPFCPGSALDSAKWVPEDALVLVSIENVCNLQEKFKQTSIYGLYKEPSMQPFIAPAEKNVRDKFEEWMEQMKQEIGLEQTLEELPLPEGRVLLVLFVQPLKDMVTDFGSISQEQFSDPDFKFDPEKLPQKEVLRPDFQMVFLAEMGSKTEDIQNLARQIAEKQAEKGAVCQREVIRGVEIMILKDSSEDNEDIDTFCYGFKDQWLITGSSLKYIRQILLRMEGSDLQSLADQRDFQDMHRSLGDSDLFFYLNANAIIDIIKATTSAEEKEEVTRIIQALGFENVTGLAAAVQMVPSKAEEIRMKTLLGVRGQKKGIPALLTPAMLSTQSNRLLTKGLAGFMVANYDPPKMYDGIVQLVWDIGQFNIDGAIQGAMAMTSQPGQESAQPPVSIRQEIIGQLRPPITISVHAEKPYTARDSSKMLFGVGVSDGRVLDTALARIHDTFIAQGNSQMRRELLNCAIYILPGLGGLPFTMQPVASGSQGGFSVASDQLVFSTVGLVEQAIRDIKRENLETIDSDPMYQYAKRYLPAQTGVFSYQNNQINNEMAWERLRQFALQKQAKSSAEEGQSQADSADNNMSDWPLGLLVEGLEGTVDFSTLPDFESVKKYFGATVSYLIGNEQGLYAEIITLNAPPEMH